jgi:hypothetical protein
MGCFIKIPIDDVTIPKSGKVCITDSWWVVSEDDCIFGYKIYGEKSKDIPSPICNKNKSLIEMLMRQNNFSTSIAKFFPVVYWWQQKC